MNPMIYKRKWPLLIYLIPAFAIMAVFLFYPFFSNIYSSFTDVTKLGDSGNWIGIKNYKDLFTDPMLKADTMYALKNTFVLMGMTVLFQVGLALLLALLVDNVRKGAQFYRTTYFFPIVISAVALGLMFNLIVLFNDTGVAEGQGLLNQVLMRLGFTDKPIDFKGTSPFLTVTLPVIWQYVGFYFVILVTGLNTIDKEIYEAAAIDGAKGLQKIYYITLPALKSTVITCVTLAITGALKVFDIPYIMLPKAANGKAYLMSTLMYENAINGRRVGRGAAIAVVIVVLGITVSQLANLLFRERGEVNK